MFIIGLAMAMGGYALAYYSVNILAWSRSPIANQTRPAPLKYIIGVPIPTAPDTTPFHPIFTIADLDRANAVYAMGGAGATDPSGAPGAGGTGGIGGLGIPGLPGGLGGLAGGLPGGLGGLGGLLGG
jgi:hypothetical protein